MKILNFSHSEQRQDLWQATCRILEQSIVSHQLHAWIYPMHCVEVCEIKDGLEVHLQSPNDFSAQWIKENYQKKIEMALSQVTGVSCVLFLKVKEMDSKPVLREFEPEVSALAYTPISSQDHPDPRYTFQHFVVGASNQFAHAAAIAVSEKPAKQYNPLFLYSAPGLGKTHLLHAIGNRFLSLNSKSRVVYLSAERFVNELIESLQHRKMTQFRAKYRNSYDLILIDDIQFIAGKNTSEEEFFHTFNALYHSRRQIVVTSDRPPKEIADLEERVRTRFEWGLVASMTPPEIETRIAILKTKAEQDDIYLPDEVANFLASHIKSNVRELEGVLIRLQAYSSLTGSEISLEMAKHELRTLIPNEGSLITIESIQSAVAKHYQLKMADFKSNTRTRTISLPRQIAMYLIRKYTGLGFKEIGHYFGGKDHTTILHACQKIEAGIESDLILKESVESIQNLL